MNRFQHISYAVLVAAVSTLAAGALPAESATSRPPNILIIVSDDQGFCELGAFTDFADPETMAAKHIEDWRKITECTPVHAPIGVCIEAARKSMPNIDRLAAQGMRLSSFIASPTCAPSRAALMTARYPQHFGVYCNDDIEGKLGQGLPLAADFPVRLFTEAGYMTGMIGKWHLGEERGQWPHQKGFEYFFGFNRAHTEKYGSKILRRNDEKVPAKGWLEDQISDEAVAFLERAEKEKRPFLLKVAYNVPHGPIPRPPQDYIDQIRSGSDNVDVYFATIYGMDAGIGRMLAQLQKAGQLDNTLIFYFSDNGQARSPYTRGFSVGEQSHLVPVPGNGPLQGCKWTPWEGGVRVPCIVRLPGGAHGSSDALLSIMDVFPTALDYAGIALPSSMPLDGQSFLPLLKTAKSTGNRTLFWAMDSQQPFGNFRPADKDLLRQVQKTGKANSRSEKHPPAWYARNQNWKLMGWDTIPPVLIDMKNDIAEKHDVAAVHPDIVEDLSGRFRTWLAGQAPPLVYPPQQWNKLKQVQ